MPFLYSITHLQMHCDLQGEKATTKKILMLSYTFISAKRDSYNFVLF